MSKTDFLKILKAFIKSRNLDRYFAKVITYWKSPDHILQSYTEYVNVHILKVWIFSGAIAESFRENFS